MISKTMATLCIVPMTREIPIMNVIKYVKILESVGISREQAEAHLQIIQEITEGELATKQDLKMLETNLLSANQVLEYRITIKLGLITVSTITIAVAILSWLIKIQ
jgi:hypothetical protein